MLPDAINTKNRVGKSKTIVTAPSVSAEKDFSQLTKSSTFDKNVNFKELANTQSKKATETSSQTKETNVINVDFNKREHATTSPVDVPNFAGATEQVETQNTKTKRGFFEKMWDRHSYHILGSLDANPAGKVAKLGVGLFSLGSIRKVAGPVFNKTSEATAAAKSMGYQKINETVHEGQAVYKKGKKYITRDLDGHNGGAWKMAKSVKKLDSKDTRDGTFNFDLSKRLGE